MKVIIGGIIIEKQKDLQSRDWLEKNSELLYHLFNKLPKATKEKANIYYNIGRILNYSIYAEDGLVKVQALIRGTEDYFTEIQMGPDDVRFQCSCSHFLAGNNCKHIGALIIKALESKNMIKKEYISANRLELLKRKHREYKTKSTTKNFIQELESKRSLNLVEMITRFEPKAIVLELHKTLDELQVRVYEQKIGVKGVPVKTGRRELSLTDLTSSYDSKFSQFVNLIKYRYETFSLKNLHLFKNVFSSYPYIYMEHKKRRLEFGPDVEIKIKKINDTVKIEFSNEESGVFFDADNLTQTSDYGIGRYIPVYGDANKSGLIFDDVIYPISSPMNQNQIRHLYDGKHNLEPVLLNPSQINNGVVKREIIAPLITLGLKFDEALDINIPMRVEHADIKAVWIIERIGEIFILSLQFDYSGIRIKPENVKNEIVDIENEKMYIRDFDFENGQLEILQNELPAVNEGNYGYSWELSLEEVLLTLDEIFVKHSQTVILECDKKLTAIKHPKTIVKVDVNSGIDWFELNFEVTADDTAVPFDSVIKAIKEDKKFIEINGQYCRLDKRELDKLKKISGKIKNFKKTMKEGWHRFDLLEEIDEYESACFDEKSTAIMSLTKDFSGIKEYLIPKSFNGILREYQINGYNWLRFLEEFNLNGILADDMGLGKTVQTIALLLSHFERNFELKGIIVCPKSLLKNWKKETEKFAPLLNCSIYHGTKHERREMRQDNPHLWITTYGTFRNDASFFNEETFDYCIVDEAQNLKNNQTKTFREMRKLSARHKIALTGTPIENSIADLKSLFDFLIPGFFGSKKEFKRLYEHNYTQLQKKIKPLILRRKKEEVLKELPPKTIKNFYVEMNEKQSGLYRNYYMNVKNEIHELTQTQEKWNDNRFEILKHILRLRQIATHPEMFLKNENIGSGKMDSLLELLEEIISEGHKTLVFSQFATMLQIVKKELDIRQMNNLTIVGSTRNRDQILDRFKEENEEQILMMTLKVGGVGLNLTEADYVIILDPWWNPAVELQAIDRTHRIGQTKPVMVYRLISSLTIEEKVLELQEKKMEIVKDVVEGKTDIEKHISAEDIREMFD